MPWLFAATIFTSAALLFAVQPIIGRMLLPRFGGAPAVWNTCMVFFQAVLLAGYAYVHVLSSRLGLRRQFVVHGLLVALAFALASFILFPLDEGRDWASAGGANPIPVLLGLLCVSIGLPFFALSTTAPLLQRWFACGQHEEAADPYFLYAASNLGSMLALLAYPILLDPTLPLRLQGTGWQWGFGLFVVLIGACVFTIRRDGDNTKPRDEALEAGEASAPEPPSLMRRLHWLALAFVPSSLLYGVTTFLSTDIAAVPLLWILPLALYLLSFILVFSRRPWITHETVVLLFPVVVLLQPFVFTLHQPIALVFGLHLVSFLILALACHGELARLRPGADHLTGFYLWLALGGVLGGLFNAILAPLLFVSLIEYPFAMVLVCFFVPTDEAEPGTPRLLLNDIWMPLILFLVVGAASVEINRVIRDEPAELRLLVLASLLFGVPAVVVYFFRSRPVRFGLAVAVLLFTPNLDSGGAEDANLEFVHQERSFFGVVRVVDVEPRDGGGPSFRRFIHGSTLHGLQLKSDDAEERRRPLSYYFRSGPIGDVFAVRADNVKEVGVLGLGAGALAAYAEPGQHWTFFEIDPAVCRVAEQYFQFLSDARARGVKVTLVEGDARLELERGKQGPFDLLFADAFSSDAVPVHLLTREAVELYKDRLAPGGWLLVNISNRYLDLEPVLAEIAADTGLVGRIRLEADPPPPSVFDSKEKQADVEKEGPETTISAADRKAGKAPSCWIVLARREADLGDLAASPRWRPLRRRGPGYLWTDDYSNLLRVLRW